MIAHGAGLTCAGQRRDRNLLLVVGSARVISRRRESVASTLPEGISVRLLGFPVPRLVTGHVAMDRLRGAGHFVVSVGFGDGLAADAALVTFPRTGDHHAVCQRPDLA